MPASSEPKAPRHEAGRRLVASAVIAAVLLLHLAAPLRFYWGGTAPDERFCWRMFSTLQADLDAARTVVRVTQVDADEPTGQQEVSLKPLPQPWRRYLHAAYPPVVDKYLRWRLEQSGADEVRYLRRAALPDGTETRIETKQVAAGAGGRHRP